MGKAVVGIRWPKEIQLSGRVDSACTCVRPGASSHDSCFSRLQDGLHSYTAACWYTLHLSAVKGYPCQKRGTHRKLQRLRLGSNSLNQSNPWGKYPTHRGTNGSNALDSCGSRIM